MKTKIFLSYFCLLLLFISSCHKEEIMYSKNELSTKASTISAITEIQALIPKNVEVFLEEEAFMQKKGGTNSYPISTIDLTDCGEQPCYRAIPSRLNQMQRTADRFCQTVNINICCCSKGNVQCYGFKIKPRFPCSPLNEK